MDQYSYYNSIFKNKNYPLAYVDLDLFEENVRLIKERTIRGNIRIASKSLRCTFFLNYLLKKGLPFKGIMSYCIEESLILCDKGFDDILLGYPTINTEQICKVAQKVKEGKKIILMIDCIEHLEIIENIGKENNIKIPVCLDLDLSTDFPGLHFGVWRSPVNNMTKLKYLLNHLKKLNYVVLDGLMGYEAQIAGIGDNTKGQKIKNLVIRLLKKVSLNSLNKRRTEALKIIKDYGINLRFVNGGGTGSIESTLEESGITEVTVGSGFYNPLLFDEYRNFKGFPAAGFAIQICRKPKNNIYTCHGGGYIASGLTDSSKSPRPYLPIGCKLNSNEGTGEVQTPIHFDDHGKLKIGDPIFFRHSKAGELCERFNFLYLIKNRKIENKVLTYRGEGFCFL